MRSYRVNPTALLAIIIAVAAARPAWLLPHAHGLELPHIHASSATHHHGGSNHAHGHHHHHGDSPGEDEPNHDHGGLERYEDAPRARWIALWRADIDAPPVAPALAVFAGPLPSNWIQLRRSKPPPLVGHPTPQLASLRTIVLRL